MPTTNCVDPAPSWTACDQARIEWRFGLLMAMALGQITFSLFIFERYVLHLKCAEYADGADCSAPAVAVEAAAWLRWTGLVGQVTAICSMPFTGLASDLLKQRRALSPTPRAPLLVAQVIVPAVPNILNAVQAYFGIAWYAPIHVLSYISGSSLAGMLGILPTFFASVADLCPTSRRAGAFLRLELAAFAGGVASQLLGGAVLGNAEVSTAAFTRVFNFAATWGVVNGLLAVILLVVAPPPKTHPAVLALHQATAPAEAQTPGGGQATVDWCSEVIGQLRAMATFALRNARQLAGPVSIFSVTALGHVALRSLLTPYTATLGYGAKDVSRLAALSALSSVAFLVAAPPLLACGVTPPAMVSAVLAISAIGGLLLASGRPRLVPLYPLLAGANAVVFPTTRALLTALVPLGQAGTMLATLGLLEQVSDAAGSFLGLSFFAATPQSPSAAVTAASAVLAAGSAGAGWYASSLRGAAGDGAGEPGGAARRTRGRSQELV